MQYILKMVKLPFYIAFACLVFASCTAKYDTSKGIEIISTEEIIPEYRLAEMEIEIVDTSNIIEFESNNTPPIVAKVAKTQNGAFAFSNNNVLIAQNGVLTTNNLRTGESKKITHDIQNPQIFANDDIILLYNSSGTFTFIDTKTLKEIWTDTLKIQGFASKFVCIEDACYILTLEGEIAILNYQYMQKNVEKYFQNQDILLNNLYTPAIIDDNIIFAIADSQYAIFNTSVKNIVEKASFADEDSTVFDINLVRNIYANSKSFVISHINGSYAYSLAYKSPLWTKNFTFKKALITENLLFFYDEKNHKIICLHIESGEVKWLKDTTHQPLFLKLDFQKNLIVGYEGGIDTINTTSGNEITSQEAGIHSGEHFVFENKLYYKQGNKIFVIK